MKDPPLREVKETLGILTAALADITTHVDQLTHGELCRWPLSAQPGTNSVDINLPTTLAPLTKPHLNTGSGRSTDTGSVDPGPNPAPGVASTACISALQVTPGQVTPVTRVNTSEASSLRYSSPQSGTVIAPITCISNPLATPVISANIPISRCSSVTPGQVTPVTRA